MGELRELHDVPSLPIHDGLIVTVPNLAVAEQVLVGSFQKYVEGETGNACRATSSVKWKGTLRA